MDKSLTAPFYVLYFNLSGVIIVRIPFCMVYFNSTSNIIVSVPLYKAYLTHLALSLSEYQFIWCIPIDQALSCHDTIILCAIF